MNQNNSITHDTREVARRVDDFYLQFCHEVNGKIKFDFDDAEIAIKWVKNNLEEMQATLHQELQKAADELSQERTGFLDHIAKLEKTHQEELQKAREQAYKDGARDVQDFAIAEIMKRAGQLRDDITFFTYEKIQSERDQPISSTNT